MGRFVSRGLVDATLLAARARVRASRWLGAFDSTMAGVAANGLSSQEIDAVTQACYARLYHPSCTRAGLYDWERDCLRRFWPDAGSILLVGAGNGRELAALEQAGYEVWALEPVRGAADACRARARHPERVFEAGFRELAELSRPSSRRVEPLSALRLERFDSVVVGWGALSHCFGEPLRRDVFRAIAALCPSGPILVSFVASADDPRLRLGKGHRVGASLGRVVGRARRLRDVETQPCLFLGPGGLAVTYDRPSLQAFARLGGREIVHLEDGQTAYPHAVFAR